MFVFKRGKTSNSCKRKREDEELGNFIFSWKKSLRPNADITCIM